jgi:hypothetical protein
VLPPVYAQAISPLITQAALVSATPRVAKVAA